jgi:prepilin-type N-terminal cleavage/methylation domain-containing protein
MVPAAARRWRNDGVAPAVAHLRRARAARARREETGSMSLHPQSPRTRKGFTLVELAVVVVIIGVLAAFGVPKLLNSVERSKAAEAFSYLSAIRDAEERYLAQQGVYASDPSQLDIGMQTPKYFTVPATITTTQGDGTTASSWSLQLTRIATSSSKGAYTVQFTQDGYDPGNSSIDSMPEINPQGTSAASGSGSGSS